MTRTAARYQAGNRISTATAKACGAFAAILEFIALAGWSLELPVLVSLGHGWIGEIIRTAIRGGDLAVRFGGEELAVFARCAHQTEAVAFAERIRRRVEETQFLGKAGRMPVTLSGGVACHAAGETLDALFARADKKLYEAKELGRNRIRD